MFLIPEKNRISPGPAHIQKNPDTQDSLPAAGRGGRLNGVKNKPELISVREADFLLPPLVCKDLFERLFEDMYCNSSLSGMSDRTLA